MKVRNLPACAGTRAAARAVRAVLTLVLGAGGACALADTYRYDERGDVESITSPRGVRTYDYDERQRLWLEQGYTGNREHEYDRNGNRATDGATVPGNPTLATYVPDSNRIATLNGAAVTMDAAGQITNDGLNTYTWDAAGRLKTVSRGGQLRATYHYDHRHRRTRKVTTAAAPQGAQSIRYQYDDRDRLMAETTDTGVPLRSYVRADDRLIAIAEHVPQVGGYQIRMLYLELDHLGTPRQARREGGTVVWRWESDGYGTTPADEDPDGDGQLAKVYLRFPGQYYDEESGLHYNWHRYYVPRLGRYLSSDPIGIVGGINTYAYANNAPTMYADPMGLSPDYWWRPCNSDQIQQCRQQCASQGKEYESCAVRWVANNGVRDGRPSNEAGTPSSGGLSCSCKEPQQQSEQQMCGGNCQKAWKAIRDAAGIIILWTFVWVCS